MFIQIFQGVFALLFGILIFIALKIKSKRIKNPKYYEITLLLGSGGHTGEMMELIRGLHFDKVNRVNVLIGKSDRAS